MYKNYLITALRNLWRSKSTTILNLSGLALGITTTLILFLLVREELSFDTFHTKRDRIYRVVMESDGNQDKNYSPGVAPVLPDAFKNDFPEAEEVVFTSYRSGSLITIPNSQGESKKYKEEKGIVYTQPNFFKVFDRKIIIGDAAKGLDEPNEAIISKKAALNYFGVEDAVGKVLRFENYDFKITAIMDDCPYNTDFPFNVMLSYITIKKEKDKNGWNSVWSDEQCYILLKQESRATEIERRIPDFVKKYLGENSDHSTFILQPLAEIHFDSRYDNYNYSTTSHQMIVALSMIGILIIITACINFINLATAEAIKRSKEVGIRKTLGSSRSQLIIQFLGESSLITLFAVLLALGLAQLGLSFLNPFLDLHLALDLTHDRSLWIFLVTLTLVVAFLSGLYPSFVVSGFKPMFAMKNLINSKNSSGYFLRRALVVLQFFISQSLIIGTIILIAQMDYFKNQDLGFKKDAIITVPIPENERLGFADGASKMRTLREEIATLPGIQQTSLSNTPPSSGNVSNTDFTVDGNDKRFEAQVKTIDGHYIDLYRLALVAGTNLLDLDTARGFLVNEKLVATIGYSPNEIIGRNIKMWGKTLPVVGVIKNFHTVSLHDAIEPTIMLNRIKNYATLSLRINDAQPQKILKQVREKWEAAYPENIFTYQYLEDSIEEFYEREQKMATLLSIFTSIAICIGCLGLFGLATFMANQKTKEIGVRKVLGASVEGIIFLFSKEYIKLILIGFTLAAPAAWYVMNQWLNEFAYKITIGPTVFIAGLSATIFVALLTVGYRSFRAALVNPVESLKSE